MERSFSSSDLAALPNAKAPAQPALRGGERMQELAYRSDTGRGDARHALALVRQTPAGGAAGVSSARGARGAPLRSGSLPVSRSAPSLAQPTASGGGSRPDAF